MTGVPVLLTVYVSLYFFYILISNSSSLGCPAFYYSSYDVMYPVTTAIISFLFCFIKSFLLITVCGLTIPYFLPLFSTPMD